MKEIKQLIRLDWVTSQELLKIKNEMEEKTINKVIIKLIKERTLLYKKVKDKNQEIKRLHFEKIYGELNNGY